MPVQTHYRACNLCGAIRGLEITYADSVVSEYQQPHR